MKKLIMLTFFLAFTITLSSCISSSQFRPIENPNIPFERPGYTILPPVGNDWGYSSNELQGRYKLSFFKKMPDSKFHTLAVGLIETPNSATFENPQEFKKYIKTTIEMAMSPNRLKILDKKIELNDKFGSYTVRYYTKSEDHRAANLGKESFLILVDFGYVFVHPSIPNLIIQVSYSERGRPNEIRSILKKETELFFNGIKITETQSLNN